MEYKYTLIISQYHYSRHMFIVEHTGDFLQRGRDFAAELIEHKRGRETTGRCYLGDLSPEWSDDKPIKPRYNINDEGDIYFIQGNSINGLMSTASKYQDDTRRESRGFQRKALVEEISKRHGFSDVADMVDKHFNIL